MATDDKERTGVSRRDLIKAVAGGAAAAATLGSGAAMAGADADSRGRAPDEGDADLALVNGRILTLNSRNTVASAVAIRDGRIVEVGRRVRSRARTIDLRGATVIPGLIDGTVRYLRTATDPGHQVRIIETATSIAELQRMISERARTVPAGEFITCIGGWNANGFAERRLPTVKELDAAAPAHPLLLSFDSYDSGGEGALTNSRGIAFFKSRGVAVNASTGLLSTVAAQEVLESGRSDADRLRATDDALGFAASVGLTTLIELGQVILKDRIESQFQFALELWRAGRLKVRLRLRTPSGEHADVASLRPRLLNAFNRFGDNVLRTNGIGDAIGMGIEPIGPSYPEDCKFIAENDWSLSMQCLTLEETTQFLAGFEFANAAHPLADLRWSLCHVNQITQQQVNTLAAMGAGAIGVSWLYLGDPQAEPGGPPWRMLLDAGLPLGAGSDATRVAALNPWLNMYYMTTGRNNARQMVNPGQSLTRIEALKAYTSGSAWHSFDDDMLGSIEPGKYADLAVLSADPLSVSDDKLRRIVATMTLQGGKIVHRSASR